MKRTITLIIFLLPFTCIHAQNIMVTHFSDGTTMELPIAIIDSINYTQNEYVSAPTVITMPAEDISSNGAIITMTLNSYGLSSIGLGLCWNTVPNPTVSDFVAYGGAYQELESLSANTTYYVRGFAENEIGFSYGNEVSFSTDPVTIPVVSGGVGSFNINDSTVTGSVSIVNDGGGIITNYGLCWSLSPNPTIADFLVDEGLGVQGNNPFATPILPPLTTLYSRTYATNSAGTGYGVERGFTTFGQGLTVFTAGIGLTDIDGNAYPTVIIGNQEWSAENLRTTRFANGDTIANEPLGVWGSSEIAYAWYDNDSVNEYPHGKLYSVTTQEDGRNLCPVGWHVSTHSDWNVLTLYLDGAADTTSTGSAQSITAGGTLRATYSWNGNISTGINESGFSAVASGYRTNYFNNYYAGQGIKALYVGVGGGGYSRAIVNYTGNLELYSADSNEGYSVRCVKD